MNILEIRIGLPKSVEECLEIYENWPEKQYISSYCKTKINDDELINITKNGIDGNECGHPQHLKYLEDRAILIFNELNYIDLQDKFPDIKYLLHRGSLGENFIVDDPLLLPNIVCIGDIYQINDILIQVSGPRAPCPKVDGVNKTKGLTKYIKETGLSGYFVKILNNGKCKIGDKLKFISRKYNNITITYVASQLWGEEDKEFTLFIENINCNNNINNKDEILQKILKRKNILYELANMPELLERHYRDTAIIKYDKLCQIEQELNSTILNNNNNNCHYNDNYNLYIGIYIITFISIGCYWYIKNKK